MNTIVQGGVDRQYTAAAPVESSHSAVSWPAILAGAFVATAVTFVLVVLATGFGFAAISPWDNVGASAKTFAISTGIGLIVVQWIGSASGGFITGRLRSKWVGVHTHEVFFRDTAHGFVMWALATVVGGMLLASATTSLIGGGANAAATVAEGAAQGAGSVASQAVSSVSGYDLDSLFRSDKPDAANAQQATAQASRILATGLANGDVPAGDRTYLAQLIANQTGISQPDAQKRVDDTIARAKAAEQQAKQAADTARKAAAEFAIFTALSLLIGAFIASAAAAYGGSLRDEH
jgi:hypothetical protein